MFYEACRIITMEVTAVHSPHDASPNARAQELADKRFRHADMNHKAMPVLKELYRQRVQAVLETRPDFKPHEQRFFLCDPGEILKRKIEKQPLGPLEAAVERIKLPTMPQVWMQLREAVADSSTNADDLARIISVDPKLTATVLSLVNSPLFGLPVKVETLTRAVTVLGTKEISGLAMCSVLISLFQDVNPDIIDVRSFWRHCVVTAIMGRNLALFAGYEEPERFFVAGLLHDLGRIALYGSEPELGAMALALESMADMSLVEAEVKVFDFDHAMLGALLLQKWHMPSSVVFAVLSHHSPHECLKSEVATVTHLANAVVVSLDLGACQEANPPSMGVEAFDRLNMDPEELVSVVAKMDRQLAEVMPYLIKD